MKKASKKTLLVLASSLMAGGMVAGLTSCGGEKSIAYDLDWSVTDEQLRGTTIDFWTGFGSDMQDIVSGLVEEFTAKTGINVNLESKGGYSDLNKAIILSASTKTYPHVALAYPDHMASYVNNDTIVRMDYYFENDGDDNYKITDFYADYMKENQSIEFKDDGTPYTLGVPFNKSTEVLTYNKTFFDWAATRDSAIKVP
ncbi:MAG: extracellular solute-binding protein, partial [Bacilli bacterium]|nr:extracellular solute-binding protein [Bacilli bacterium]